MLLLRGGWPFVVAAWGVAFGEFYAILPNLPIAVTRFFGFCFSFRRFRRLASEELDAALRNLHRVGTRCSVLFRESLFT